jgi:hypothetical protein
MQAIGYHIIIYPIAEVQMLGSIGYIIHMGFKFLITAEVLIGVRFTNGMNLSIYFFTNKLIN